VKNLFEMLKSACERNASKVFFVRENITYSEFLRKVMARAVAIRKIGLNHGDVVALASQNSANYIITYFALVSQGIQVLMLDASHTKNEHLSLIERTGARIMVGQKRYQIPEVAFIDIETIDENDTDGFVAADLGTEYPASISFTSGSTGAPKIVVWRHGSLLDLYEGLKSYRDVFGMNSMTCGVLPFSHIYGVITHIMEPLANDGSILIQVASTSMRGIMEDFVNFKPNVAAGVPRVWELYYKAIEAEYRKNKKWRKLKFLIWARPVLSAFGLDFIVRRALRPAIAFFGGNMRALMTGGAALKPAVMKFFDNLGWYVGNGYGSTESGGTVVFDWNLECKMIHTGAFPGCQVKIAEPDETGAGEIWLRGHMIFTEYVGNPEATAESFTDDGWFKTGDIGYFAKNGRLMVKGRKKLTIVLDSGQNIYPDELQDLYAQNPEILSAAVVEHNVKGRDVAYAVFQVIKGATIEEIDALVRKSNTQIASYKRIRHFAITEEELPMTPTRKIKHHEVKKLLGDGYYTNRCE
jgi:long-chain acyl-CoA synthetase